MRSMLPYIDAAAKTASTCLLRFYFYRVACLGEANPSAPTHVGSRGPNRRSAATVRCGGRAISGSIDTIFGSSI